MKKIFAFACIIGLAACSHGSDLKETLGLNRKGPDEFAVVSRPALSVPPEFNLTPPKQGADSLISASTVSASEQAHGVVLGNPTSSTKAATAVPLVASGNLPSGADSQLLSNAGADKAKPDIRSQIAEDSLNGKTVASSPYLLGNKKDDPIVDSKKEVDRIKQNKDQNQPITGDDTPTIAPKSKGIFGDWF